MTAKLVQNNDGADFQSQAVLAYVRYLISDGLVDSWNPITSEYQADIRVTRYDNCREQGYIIYLRNLGRTEQINICFYEHRNSDQIYVQVNDVVTFNAPLSSDIYGSMTDKYQSAFDAPCGKAFEVAEFIKHALENFWRDKNPA